MRRTMKHNATQFVFNDFSGGINVMSEGDLIAQNEMQECQNFYFLGYQRSLTARGGLSKPLVTFPVEILGTYYDIDSTQFIFKLTEDVLVDLPAECRFVVPRAMIQTYKAQNIWKDYASRFIAMEDCQLYGAYVKSAPA